MRVARVVIIAAIGLGVAACGGSPSANPPANPSSPTTVHVPEVASDAPSESAQMVCDEEAKTDIAKAVGTDTAAPPQPSWSQADHLYSCVYPYADGDQMTLSVKELSSDAETDAYFGSIGDRLGHGQSFPGLGQGAYATSDGSVVVRKDYKVLFVDVSHLPPSFGSPPISKDQVAQVVGAGIIGCWTGA